MLYEHQTQFLIRNPDKTTLVWSCGTGKTRAAVEWASMGYDDSYLIVCPKPLKANWIREVGMWGAKTTRFKVMTKEEFRAAAPDLDPVDGIIVDEVHNGFLTPHFKSQMSKAIVNYIGKHHVKRVLLLTATPYTSSPWNIYNLAYITGTKWPWLKFKLAFFNDVRMGARIVPVVKKGAEKKLAQLIPRIAEVVDINDIMDVPLQFHAEPEYFALSGPQKKAVRENYDPVPIVRFTHQHEIENGFVYSYPGEVIEYTTFPSDKLDRIKLLVEENPKIAIVCRYNAQIDILIKELADHRPFVIRGSVPDRDSVTRTADQASRAVVLIQADCAEGYELPSFPIVVFASQSYSYVKWEQVCGRFLRMNRPSRTAFLYLLAEGDSVDQAIYDCVKKKEDFKIELFAKNRAKKK